jgi:hypothetical protein
MAAQWAVALAAAVGLVVDVGVQITCFRIARVPRLFRSVLVGFAAGLAATIGTTLACAEGGAVDVLGQVLANGVTFAALGYGYFHFVNLGETARRVRILREFVDAGGHLTQEQVLERYNADEIVGRRFERLLKNGQVRVRQGRYVIGNPSVYAMALVLEGLRVLLLGKRGKSDR